VVVVELIAPQVEVVGLAAVVEIVALMVAQETPHQRLHLKEITAAMVLVLMTHPEAVVGREPLDLLRQQAIRVVMVATEQPHLYQDHR
jgi:hypothetical protein